MAYNHFQYGELLATKLSAIKHTAQKNKFFRAFGLEDLIEFTDKLSSVSGTILIAIDGSESKVFNNEADGVFHQKQYSFIVASSTSSNNSKTIFQSIAQSESIAYQIINRLMLDNLNSPIGLDTDNIELNGIGPIGDNFYGVIFSFSITQSTGFSIDQSFWEE